MDAQPEEIDWERLDRYVRKLGTFDELAALERWVDGDPALQQAAAAMRTIGRRPGAREPNWNERAAWDALKQRMGTPVRALHVAKSSGEWRAAGGLAKRMWGGSSANWASAAALFVLLIGGAALTVWMKRRQPAGQAAASVAARKVETTRGERREIRFDDGTVITLGPRSEIQYAFDAQQRRVDLKGLANFRVAHDSTRPFTVQAGTLQATDLGTEFSVRAYPGEARLEVVVRAGRVGLRAHSYSGRPVELRSRDVAGLDSVGTIAVRHGVDVARLSSWMSGRLAFEDQPLSEVGVELARWFDVDVQFVDTGVARRRITAVFGDPSLKGVLDALSETLSVHYERSGRIVTFSRRPH